MTKQSAWKFGAITFMFLFVFVLIFSAVFYALNYDKFKGYTEADLTDAYQQGVTAGNSQNAENEAKLNAILLQLDSTQNQVKELEALLANKDLEDEQQVEEYNALYSQYQQALQTIEQLENVIETGEKQVQLEFNCLIKPVTSYSEGGYSDIGIKKETYTQTVTGTIERYINYVQQKEKKLTFSVIMPEKYPNYSYWSTSGYSGYEITHKYDNESKTLFVTIASETLDVEDITIFNISCDTTKEFITPNVVITDTNVSALMTVGYSYTETVNSVEYDDLTQFTVYGVLNNSSSDFTEQSIQLTLDIPEEKLNGYDNFSIGFTRAYGFFKVSSQLTNTGCVLTITPRDGATSWNEFGLEICFKIFN